ncbi:hypothetical protein MMF93_00240 [Streptomyces tubbatahanensis]|uniref:Uncharacterized protein n=1 Tax=Streptomyces tubbatahanensis TaxID=2923272 RepID=A0ABY3XKY7_9ACTN|nr:hypothetical protein [Streptomyces tubbatahanensis]UNS95061.1 hypothetical protein MMF93_00240 [Streptomyces tubbatahanensis]
MRELGEWAADVLRTRWLSMRVNREKLVAVYGERQQKAVLETIATALSEIRRGTVMPALVAARRGPLDRG